MTALAIEAEAELPWVGGFLLVADGHAADWQLEFSDGEVRARLADCEIRWRIDAAQPVHVLAFDASIGSAT